MPNRILREGILTSPRIAKLGWPEEVFYRRLMSVVDDFGRYYADLGLLHAACYPRQLNKVSDSDIGKWLASCEAAALVRVYPAEDGERYLQVLDFGQQVRAKKSRFPEPRSGCAADATQVPSESEAADAPTQANERLDVSVSVSEGVSGDVFGGDKSRKRDPSPDVARPDDVGEQVWADWCKLRKTKKAPVTETVVTEARRQSDLADLTLEQFLTIWCLRGSQGLQASWLKPEERRQVQAQSFAERDREAGMRRWEQMTGQVHPDRAGNVIDMPGAPAQPRISA